MKARARLTVGGGPSGAHACDVYAEPPFAIRQAGGRFLIVGSAAAPVRGDDLGLEVRVGPGVATAVGTAAATVVWAGPDTADLAPSRMVTRIDVGSGAALDWSPEPTVSVAGSDHVVETRVELAPDASCRIIEEFALGRSGEPAGRLRTRLRVTRGGRALVDHGEVFGPDLPGAGSLARAGAARHVLTAVIVGPATAASSWATVGLPGVSVARIAVTDDVAVVLAAGPDRPSVLAASRDLVQAWPVWRR